MVSPRGPRRETERVPPPEGFQRMRLELAYDGEDFFGWQVQPRRETVQGALERVVQELTGRKARVFSSGRTDTGVHARAQVAHLDVPAGWKPGQLQLAMNALLPESVRVVKARRARPDFHARFDATGKEYRYSIWNAPVACPLHRRQALHVRLPLDVAAMRAAAALLEGTHDFASFSANPRRDIGETVRTLRQLQVTRRGALVTIKAVGDGFLYKMVRSLAGHLIRVGTGAVSVEETTALLEARKRTARVETAPAHGLCLWRVNY